ncbi:hypothetical protein [Paraburkholderia caledonica]|uniref:Chemotaxis protein n=1 Tax=Paraburkholderia caledonica TaxID=134536 RepID=A0AB73IPA7_9BURK|nr:hypothetical protein [Paraburkholderia caledonica]
MIIQPGTGITGTALNVLSSETKRDTSDRQPKTPTTTGAAGAGGIMASVNGTPRSTPAPDASNTSGASSNPADSVPLNVSSKRRLGGNGSSGQSASSTQIAQLQQVVKRLEQQLARAEQRLAQAETDAQREEAAQEVETVSGALQEAISALNTVAQTSESSSVGSNVDAYA